MVIKVYICHHQIKSDLHITYSTQPPQSRDKSHCKSTKLFPDFTRNMLTRYPQLAFLSKYCCLHWAHQSFHVTLFQEVIFKHSRNGNLIRTHAKFGEEEWFPCCHYDPIELTAVYIITQATRGTAFIQEKILQNLNEVPLRIPKSKKLDFYLPKYSASLSQFFGDYYHSTHAIPSPKQTKSRLSSYYHCGVALVMCG